MKRQNKNFWLETEAFRRVVQCGPMGYRPEGNLMEADREALEGLERQGIIEGRPACYGRGGGKRWFLVTEETAK